ncbi:MAG: GIY-YIG nuclease family protein [Bacteroidaceae bacterium]
MNAISGIYKIENLINGKLYIGQSKDIKLRWIGHRHLLKKGTHSNCYLQSACNKYGLKNFKFTILETCDISQLNEKEIYWIKKLNSFVAGYNLSSGGSFNNEKSCIKVVCLTTGVIYKSLSEAARQTGVSRPSISKCCKKKSHYCGICKDTGEKLLWVYYDEYINMTQTDINYLIYLAKNPYIGTNIVRKVVCLNTGEVFYSLSEAARRYSLSPSGIIGCCVGKSSHTGIDDKNTPLCWAYYEDYLQMTKEEVSELLNKAKEKIPSPVVCLNTRQIFNTMNDAVKMYGISSSGIIQACKEFTACGKDESGNKLLWLYLNDYNHTSEAEITSRIEYSNGKMKYHGGTRPVICLNTSEIFTSAKAASLAYDTVSDGVVHSCCTGKSHSAGTDKNGEKLVWLYYDQYLNMNEKEIKKKKDMVNNWREFSAIDKKVICLTTGEIFSSITNASHFYNIHINSLCGCLKGRQHTSGKHSKTKEPLYWDYYDNYMKKLALSNNNNIIVA